MDNQVEHPIPTHKLFYDVATVAEVLSVGRTTAWALIRSGEPASARIGKRVLVSRAALEDYARRLETA